MNKMDDYDGDVLVLLKDGNVSDLGSFIEDDIDNDDYFYDETEIIRNRMLDEFENPSHFLVDQSSHLPPKRKIQWLQKPFNQPILNLNELDEPECIEKLKSPLEYFSEYFGNEMFEKMAFNTNVYATQKNLGSAFKLTDANEMRIFIAINIIMGSFPNFDTREYWEKSILSNGSTDLVAQNMTRERFYFLRNNFHIIDNNDIPVENKDKFIKVRPLYNSFLQKCRSFPVERNISINEQMIPFKDKLAMNTYVIGKPLKWSVKMFLLCGESGLIYNSLLFQGNFELDGENVKNYGFGGSIVLHLTENIKPNSHFLFFHDYFSSFGLFEKLYHLGIYATGTVRIKRLAKAPLLSNKLMRKMGGGTTFEITTELSNNCNLSLVKWFDDEPMHLASNYIASGEVDKVRRWDMKHQTRVVIDRPEIARVYTKAMKILDKMNQMVSDYQRFIRSRKWVLQVAMHVIDLAIYNSWIEYKNHADILKVPKKTKCSYLMIFRLKLAQSLIRMSKPEQYRSQKNTRYS